MYQALKLVSLLFRTLGCFPCLIALLSAASVDASNRTSPTPVGLSEEGWESDDSVPSLMLVVDSDWDDDEAFNMRPSGRLSFEELVDTDVKDYISRLARQQ